MEFKSGMYEEIVVLTALYSNKAWLLENKVKNRVDMMAMLRLRSIAVKKNLK